MNRIVLASSSKRRIELLEQYDLEIEVFSTNIDEIQRKFESAAQVAMSLSFQKALYASKFFENGEVILGADTLVSLGDKILGKPESEEDAFNMLSLLSGKEHRVITGISIIKSNSTKKIIDYESTRVKFRTLDKRQILKYIDTSEPMDKAGGYGIQGYGKILVEKIYGSYTNVVGLPLIRVDKLLSRFFDIKIL